MATDTGSISDGSVGFLSQSGQVKSKKENQEAVEKIDRATAPEAKPGEGATESITEPKDTISGQFESAIGAVRSRTEGDIGRIAETVGTDGANLRSAKKLVQQEIEVARELKTAIKEGDTGKADKLREDFAKLEEQRAELTRKVDQDNEAAIGRRVDSVRVGNDTKGRIETSPVQLDRPSPVDLDSKEGVDAVIRDRREELGSIRIQIQENRGARDELKAVADEARKQIDGVEQSTIRSFSEASDLAAKLAKDIKAGSQERFVQAAAGNVNQQVIAQLLQ